MPMFESGDVIGIPCNVQPGPFSGEFLISLETVSGLISGFVKSSEIQELKAGQPFVRAVVQSLSDDEIEVKIRGSFFTTNGFATVPRQTVLAA
jgi:hypothetical protein